MSESVGRLGHVAAAGAASVAASQGIKIGTQFLSVAVLSRLLTPADFGMIALISPLMSFVSLFQDLGLQQAIVQRREVLPAHLTPAFWFTIIFGFSCSGIVAALSPGVAAFFGDERLLMLTIATTPSLLFAALSSVPSALMNRRLEFRTLAIIDVASTVIAFAAAVVGACLGAHYWSLTLGTVVGSVVTFCGVWWFAGWMPGRPTLRQLDRGMLSFGANLTGFSVVTFLARNLDNVLIGRFVGSVALGYYDRAYKLMVLPLANVSSPIGRIVIPLMSRIQGDKPRLREMFLRIASQIGLITLPGMAALVATSDQTVNLIFGPGWHEIVPIFAWLGLAGLLQPTTSAVVWLLVAQGRTTTMLRWGLYSSTTTIASFVIGLRWGAAGVACAYAVSEYVVRLPVVYVLVSRVGPITAIDLARIQVPLLAAAGLSALFVMTVLRQRFGLEGLPLVSAAVLVSYGTAITLMAVQPRSRSALYATFLLFWQLGRRIRPA